MMARIRTIKPEFFKSEQVAELDPINRLLFIGLWTLADNEGKLLDRPKRIRAELFPYDEIDMDGALKKLHDSKLILRYKDAISGLELIKILNFQVHQRISGKEAFNESKLPDPDAAIVETHVRGGGINREAITFSPMIHGPFTDAQERKGKEGKGKEGNREKSDGGEPPTRPKEKKKISVGFENSDLAKNPDLLKMAIMGKPYQDADVDEYIENARAYSAAKGAKYVDWTAAVTNWIRRDFKEGKLKSKNHVAHQSGVKSNIFAGRTKADFGQL